MCHRMAVFSCGRSTIHQTIFWTENISPRVALRLLLLDDANISRGRFLHLSPQLQIMNSEDLARYIEATDNISKPWLLVQLRLKKLQERRSALSDEEYTREVADIHQDLMKLGEWWKGIEDEVF
jgi:hypothetical protein